MKVLHIVSGLDAGGVEKLLWEYCSRIQINDSYICFDFITHEKQVGMIEKKFLMCGNNIFHIPSKSENIFLYVKELYSIIRVGNYDVVHCHQGYTSFLPLMIAFLFGVKCRIAHTHMAYISNVSKFKNVYSFLTKVFATDLFACSTEAARWTWGCFALKHVVIMRNAIDVKLYLYNENTRVQLLKKLELEDKFVVGNIGRMLYQKNHKFLIEIFDEIKKMKPNAVLLLIGNGDLKGDIVKQLSDLNLGDSVFFMESIDDIYNYYNIMDVFLLPSRYEGLGIVNIEAQANGLKTFTSANVVPKDAKISELLTFISLKKPAVFWARKIMSQDTYCHMENMEPLVTNKGYNINKEWKKLKRYYYNALKR